MARFYLLRQTSARDFKPIKPDIIKSLKFWNASVIAETLIIQKKIPSKRLSYSNEIMIRIDDTEKEIKDKS